MKIDGFTYVRNGVKMGYPFVSSINSLLPLVDKLFIAVGNSDDETKLFIQNINNSKIHIIDTVWNEDKRQNGDIFKEQANIALSQTTADWCFHLQVDEVLKEDSYDEIYKFIKIANKLDDVDGLLFPFLHFWGDYNLIRNTRKTHDYEIRAFKNNRNILSYKDSQGFRKYNNALVNHKGEKLKVLKTPIPIYHYSYTRNPALMKTKANYFHRFWHDDTWLKEHTNEVDFDFNDVDKLEFFHGEHPIYMKEFIEKKDWNFEYDPSKSTMGLKDKILYKMEKLLGHRFFAYKNYQIKQIPPSLLQNLSK